MSLESRVYIRLAAVIFAGNIQGRPIKDVLFN